jgi:hypothetical protein
MLTDVAASQTLTLHHETAMSFPSGDHLPVGKEQTEQDDLFNEEARTRGLAHHHEEFAVPDFDHVPLLPHRLSKGGPGIAVGDVNGDGLDDVFVGADRRRERTLFMQTSAGQFEARSFPIQADRYEDMAPLFFDAEGDGDLDLYVVSGGNAAPAGDASYQDRLYVNDGSGAFRRVEEALPDMRTSGSVVTAADYDGDGDLDLLVGGRHIPRRYPLPPRSYLLRNESRGGGVQFTDVTNDVAPGLAEVGLVTDALWTDFNQDGRRDLLIAGEWMPLTFFENRGSEFVEVTASVGLGPTVGWWNSLAGGDFDRDGDIDYIAGNLGANTKYKATPEEPVRVYAKDFDGNGSVDPVVTRYIQGSEYPVAGYDQMVKQIPGMKYRFRSYSSYAKATFQDLFTEGEREGAYVVEAVHFETSYLENQGRGTFTLQPLPIRAQFAPVFGISPGDYDGNGHLDALLVGNSHATETLTGWYDAMVGVLLRGDGTDQFEAMHYTESGFYVHGDAKAIASVEAGAQSPLTIVAQNDGPLKAFAPNQRRHDRVYRLEPTDRYALLTFEDGSRRRQEFYYGSTYLSQSSRVLRLPALVEEAVVVNSRGQQRTLDLREDSLLLVEKK